MQRRFSFILISIVALTTANCYYDNEEKLYGEEICSTEPITYSSTVSLIIRNNCLSCHSQAISTAGIALETHAQVKIQADNGKLIGVITHSGGFTPMPKNAPQLSQCNIDAIRQWIESGALNN